MPPISRRTLFSRAIAAPAVLGAAPERTRALKVVVAGGHPGDPEYGCSGTVARFTDLGHAVTLLYLNSGQKVCPETKDDPGSTVRTKEAQHACTILKANPRFAGQCDGHAVVDDAHYREFGTMLETLSPDLVFTQWPLDGHRDHRATFMLVYDLWRKSSRCFSTKSRTAKIRRCSLLPTTSIFRQQSRENAQPATPTLRKHRTDTTRYNPRSRASAVSKAATVRLKHSLNTWAARAFCFLEQLILMTSKPTHVQRK